ncbi:MAG TPA: hypothetical protein VFC94_05655 [Bacteroidaceae bacterium]|nr:hypothetical protein [Bacteroidaceae bacterium]
MYKGETQTLIQNTFNRIFDLIQGVQEETLFEQPDNTPRTLAEAIEEVLNIKYNGQEGSNILAGNSTTSQDGQGSSRDSQAGERAEGGNGTTIHPGGTKSNSGERIATLNDQIEEAAVEVNPDPTEGQKEDFKEYKEFAKEAQREGSEPKPIGTGAFGAIYDQFKGKPKEAVVFLMEKREGEALGVFNRDGLGAIDLPYGSHKDKYGLEHIIEKHVKEQDDFSSVEEAISIIEDVITNGDVSRENNDKIVIDKDDYRVVVQRNIRDERGNITGSKNWVVTGFDTARNVKEKTPPRKTLTTPLSNQMADGVTLPSSGVSTSKDKQEVSNLQEKGDKKEVLGKTADDFLKSTEQPESTDKQKSNEEPQLREDLRFLEGELGNPPIKKERIDTDKASGRLNVKPIPVTPKKETPEKALTRILSKDDLRPVLQGVFYDANNKVMVAADTYRMLVIPNKAIKKTRILDPKTNKEIEGQFPNYREVIPKNENVAEIKDISPLIAHLNGIVKANKFITKGIIAEIEYDGKIIYVNPAVMLDVLTAMQNTGTKSVRMELPDEVRAIVLRDGDKTGLALPVLIGEGPLIDRILSLDVDKLEQNKIRIEKTKAEINKLENNLSFGEKYHAEQIAKGEDVPWHEKELKKDQQERQAEIDELKQKLAELEEEDDDFDVFAELVREDTPEEIQRRRDEAKAAEERELDEQYAKTFGSMSSYPKSRKEGIEQQKKRYKEAKAKKEDWQSRVYQDTKAGWTAEFGDELDSGFGKSYTYKDLNERKRAKQVRAYEAAMKGSLQFMREMGLSHEEVTAFEKAQNTKEEKRKPQQPWEQTKNQFAIDKSVKIDSEVKIVDSKPVYTYTTTINGENYSVESNRMLGGSQITDRMHEKIVKQAIAEGKEVPENIKKEVLGKTVDDHTLFQQGNNITPNRGKTLSKREFGRFVEAWNKAMGVVGRVVTDARVFTKLMGQDPRSVFFHEQWRAINERFNAELQQLIDGTLPHGHIFQLGNPTRILQSAGIPNLPIELSADRLKNKSQQQNHPFELADVTNLPSAIQNPIAVFESTKKDGTKVLLTELTDSKGNNYVVAVRVQKSANARNLQVEVNSVRSLYPKDHAQGILDWINSKDNLLVYADKEKALNFIQSQSTNLIAARAETKGLENTDSKQQYNSAEVESSINAATNIIQNFENPRVDEAILQADYRMHHTAPVGSDGFSVSIDRLNELYPDDVYSNMGWYYYGDGDRAMDKKTHSILKFFRGKPDNEITVYRAVPKGVTKINSGDWVSINREYAVKHGESNIDKVDRRKNKIEKLLEQQ